MTIQALPAMQTALATQQNFSWADLYTFASPVFGQARFCGGTLPLQITKSQFVDPNSLNYGGSATLEFPVGIPFSRSQVTREVGVNPSKVEIMIGAGANDLLFGNLTWQQCVNFGFFEDCVVEVDRYLPGPGGWLDTSLGAIVWFYGKVGDIEFGRSKIKMDVLSLLSTLNQQQLPRRVYGASCTHVFGDNMCLFNRATLAVTVTALTGSTQNTIVTNLVPSPADLYVEGDIEGITTGPNIGFTQTIAQMSGGIINVTGSFPYTVSPGDQFQLNPGCPHSIQGCIERNNLQHYGGMPYIPPPELAI